MSDQVTLANNDESRAGRALLWKGAQLGVSKSLYLLGSLILGHLLAPKEFGLVAIATVAVTTLMAATETGMTSALVQASAREQANYDVAWTIGMLRGLFVCVLLLLASPLIAAVFGDVHAVSLLRLMAFVPLIASIASPRQADLIRALRFSTLATIGITAAAMDIGVAIALAGSLGGKAIALGKLAGATTATLASYLAAPYRPRFRMGHSSGRHLIAFGRWLFAIGVTGATSDFFLKLIVARRLSVGDLGVFAMADKLGETPSQFANEAIGAVAFPLYARLRNDPARMQSVFRAHLTGLMFFLLPTTALLISLALPLQQRVLGDRWSGASTLIVLLTLGFLSEFVFNAIYFLLQGLGKGARLFVVELAQYVTLIALISLLTAPYGLVGIGSARIITGAVVGLAGIASIAPDLRRVVLGVSRPALFLTALAALAGIAAKVCTVFVPDTVGLAVGAVIGASTFLVLAWLTDQPFNLGIRACLSLFFPSLSSEFQPAPVA